MTARTPKIPSAWHPAKWETADAAAIQALMRGDARPDQQQRAMYWIVECASGAYQTSYRPGGEEGRRDSDFAEGRRSVGLQIVKLSKINLNHPMFEQAKEKP